MTGSEITVALESAKALLQIARGIKQLNTETEINEVKSDLIDKILQLNTDLLGFQERYSFLLKEKDVLATQLMKMEKWDEEKNLYDLAEVSVGNFVYIRKEHKGKKNNFLYYCANCFGSSNISILQCDYDGGREKSFLCHKCGSKITYGDGGGYVGVHTIDFHDI